MNVRLEQAQHRANEASVAREVELEPRLSGAARTVRKRVSAQQQRGGRGEYQTKAYLGGLSTSILVHRSASAQRDVPLTRARFESRRLPSARGKVTNVTQLPR